MYTLAARCVMNTCSRNSSPTLNTLTPLSTCTRHICSLMLSSDPCSAGLPQNIKKMTRRHSQRKWKSPRAQYTFHSVLNVYFLLLYIQPGVSRAHVSLFATFTSDALHSLDPRMFLHVSWSPMHTHIMHTCKITRYERTYLSIHVCILADNT